MTAPATLSRIISGCSIHGVAVLLTISDMISLYFNASYFFFFLSMIFLSSSLTYRYLSILFLINLSLSINLSSSFRNNCIINLIILSRTKLDWQWNWNFEKIRRFRIGKTNEKISGSNGRPVGWAGYFESTTESMAGFSWRRQLRLFHPRFPRHCSRP